MLGGAVGAGLRALLLLPLAGTDAAGPVAIVTLIENVVGSLALGVVVAVVGDRRPLLRAFAGTGVLGGFTTYSAFAVQSAETMTDAPALAVALVAASVLLGLVAALAGLVLGRRLTRRPPRPLPPVEAE
jgi:CrcB protein